MRLKIVAVMVLCMLWGAGCAADVDKMEAGFTQPSDQTKPWVYWYWLSGHITKEGISKDLEAMKEWGIGQAMIGDINRSIIARGEIEPLSDEYFAMLEHAVREGKRLGVDIGVFNCPGWSQAGGPWVNPEESMRHIVCTERRVTGPMKLEDKLAEPPILEGPGVLPEVASFIQDAAVLAFRSPRGDSDVVSRYSPRVNCTPSVENAQFLADGSLETVTKLAVVKGTASVEISVSEPFTARSLTLYPPPFSVIKDRGEGVFDAQCRLEAEGEDGVFHGVREFLYERKNFSTSVGPMPRGPVTVAFEPQKSRRYRVIFENVQFSSGVTEAALAEVELSGGARLDKYVEQQLGKMCQGIFPAWDQYIWLGQSEPGEQFCVDPGGIVDLSDRLQKDGTLSWDVPAGEWVIVRFMMKPTGVKNVPAAREATGLEADKMSAKAMESHFNAYVGKLLSRMPADQRTALRTVVIDSYETGSENWTDGFEKEFTKVYGYDPRPWMPVLTGRLVGSADESNRFMWDMRRLVADMIAGAYGSFREVGNRYGLKLWLEPYGHYGYPAEFLQCGGEADGVGGEFWMSPKHGDMEVLAAASSAHIYGKRAVSAEAFTGTPSYGYTQSPWSLKQLGDLQQSKGVNHFVLHVYIHQPYDDRRPGMNAWFGTEFNRLNTWFGIGKSWIDYLRRSHYLLQQGNYVADVAYFIGEDAPKMSGIREPELPSGYCSDYINGEVIKNRLKVKDGRFVLADGMSYRLLVLPPLDTMRPEILIKLRELISAGGAVLGSPPSRSPSMKDYPKADIEVKRLSKEIWADLDGKVNRQRRFGKGWVFNGLSVQQALDSLNVSQDMIGLDVNVQSWTGEQLSSLPWIHRSSTEGEIYFISNQSNESVSVNASFRVSGRQPELWDAVSGSWRALPEFRFEGGRTIVPLEFCAGESFFVVFRKPAGVSGQGSNFPKLQTICELQGSWNVRFDAGLGGPNSVVLFEELADWLSRGEESIRNYSGKAVYQKNFDLGDSLPEGKVYLDLGKVRDIARVRLNGKDMGVVWCDPWRVDITSAVKAKNNSLEIEVVNTWINRLLADEKLPEGKQISWVARPAIRAQVPQSAGLLGPVTLKLSRKDQEY